MFSASDFADLYDGLGVPATYTPPTGSPVSGRVVFSQPGSVEFNGEIVSTEPSLRYPVSNFPNVIRGGVFAVAGSGNWRVRQAPSPTTDAAEMQCPVEAVA
jgi:hypothetical protein